jgi:hypothetical protein
MACRYRGADVKSREVVQVMNSQLKREFDYFRENQEELVDKYKGKVVVIKECRVVGVFDNEIEAVEQASKVHDVGTFLVQRCEPGPESYTRVFHSRVAVV